MKKHYPFFFKWRPTWGILICYTYYSIPFLNLHFRNTVRNISRKLNLLQFCTYWRPTWSFVFSTKYCGNFVSPEIISQKIHRTYFSRSLISQYWAGLQTWHRKFSLKFVKYIFGKSGFVSFVSSGNVGYFWIITLKILHKIINRDQFTV